MLVMSRLGTLNNQSVICELVQKYKLLRASLKNSLYCATATVQEKLDAANQLFVLPRRASAVRLRNRCFVTGRPRGYYRMFGVSRIVLRQMTNAGQVPGANKSS